MTPSEKAELFGIVAEALGFPEPDTHKVAPSQIERAFNDQYGDDPEPEELRELLSAFVAWTRENYPSIEYDPDTLTFVSEAVSRARSSEPPVELDTVMLEVKPEPLRTILKVYETDLRLLQRSSRTGIGAFWGCLGVAATGLVGFLTLASPTQAATRWRQLLDMTQGMEEPCGGLLAQLTGVPPLGGLLSTAQVILVAIIVASVVGALAALYFSRDHSWRWFWREYGGPGRDEDKGRSDGRERRSREETGPS